jgi:DNA-binding NtrC family response regulator
VTDRVIAFTGDLMFSSNIEATLGRAGYKVETVDDLEALDHSIARDAPAVIVLDLHAGATVEEVVGRAGSAPVLAFGRHTEPELLRAARQAGCVNVVARSTFVEEMVDLVRAASGSIDE